MAFSQFLLSNWPLILAKTSEHLTLALVALLGAVLVGVPLGTLIARIPRLQGPVLGLANIVQTVPSLALFGFLLPVLGLGSRNAVVALLLYSLLPIIRNTFTGIAGVDKAVRDAADAMGMTPGQILRRVELPLAADVILAGIRVAAVLCIGITTIASFIGAGGLGELIQNGLRTNDNAITLAGAIPAAVLALGVDGLLGAWQNWLASRRVGAVQSRVKNSLPWAASSVAACLLLGLWLMPIAATPPANTAASGKPFRVASKEFTESRILAEILVLAAKAQGINAVRAPELGGNLCHQALLAGKAEAYPEYTGTAYADILKLPVKTDAEAVYQAAATEYPKRFHLELSPPLGFSNGFAMLVRGEDAKRLKLKTLSDAVPYAPQWKAAFGPDFITRADGWPGLSKAYGLQLKTAPLSLDLGLLNRALASKQVDLIAGNETDGTIPSLGLFELQDDRQYFPPYQGVFVVREGAVAEQPKLRAVLDGLKDSISTADMQKMNYEVDGKKRAPAEVAAEWWGKR